jgi:hypothetical protein
MLLRLDQQELLTVRKEYTTGADSIEVMFGPKWEKQQEARGNCLRFTICILCQMPQHYQTEEVRLVGHVECMHNFGQKA